MRKNLLLILVLLLALMAGCQRPKPQIILPEATEPVTTPTTAPQTTATPLLASPTPTATLVATPTATLVAAPTPSATAMPQVTVHTVSFGETLFSIAQAYGVTVEAIAAANGLTYPYLIYVGQELVIPEVGEVTPVAGQVYVVQYGDTLYSIASRFNTTPEAIAAANNLPDMNTIYVGQRLVIP